MSFRRACAAALLTMTCTGAMADCTSPSVSQHPGVVHAYRLYKMLWDRDLDGLEAESRRSLDLHVVETDGQPVRIAWAAALRLSFDCQFAERALDPQRATLLKEYRDIVHAWMKKYPASESAKLANAKMHIKAAWTARGETYASKVPAEAWPIFRREMEEARKALEAMKSVGRDDPEWYVARISVAIGQSMPREQYAALVDEAAKRFPSYMPIYSSASVYYEPKWGGSEEERRAFIERSTSRPREGAGDVLYTRLQWALATYDMFETHRVDWTRMKAGFETIVASFPDPWNINNYAMFACRALDSKTASDLLKRIDRPIMEAWDKTDWYSCQNLVASYRFDPNEEVRKYNEEHARRAKE